MKYLLDTDICVFLLSGREPKVHLWMQAVPPTDIAISSVTQGEMYSGAARSQQPVRTRETQFDFFLRYASLSFDDAAANEYGQIDGLLKSRGLSIGPLDTQIASIARVHGLTLVTHNTRHFKRIPSLEIEDWTAESSN